MVPNIKKQKGMELRGVRLKPVKQPQRRVVVNPDNQGDPTSALPLRVAVDLGLVLSLPFSLSRAIMTGALSVS